VQRPVSVPIQHAAGAFDQVIEPAECVRRSNERGKVRPTIHNSFDAVPMADDLLSDKLLDY
jgi:hypothetical protein